MKTGGSTTSGWINVIIFFFSYYNVSSANVKGFIVTSSSVFPRTLFWIGTRTLRRKKQKETSEVLFQLHRIENADPDGGGKGEEREETTTMMMEQKSQYVTTTNDNNHRNVITLHTIDNVAQINSLSSSLPRPPPPILLVHGLDSSSHTWKSTLDSLAQKGYPAVAVDCRGCGLSDLGAVEEFIPKNLVEDLHCVVETHPLLTSSRTFILVGHSMGGRLGILYAAHYPSHVTSLIIEDMDIRQRFLQTDSPIAQTANRTLTLNFERKLTSLEDVYETFESVEYPRSMVQRWINEGRIRRIQNQTNDGDNGKTSGDNDDDYSYYSDVNPAFRRLCYEQIFENPWTGKDTWQMLATNSNNVSCHVMVASDDGTVCSKESIEEMKQIMPQLSILRYPTASHSIHNTAHDEFIQDLINIVNESLNGS